MANEIEPRAPFMLATPSVVRLQAVAARAELELRRQLLHEADTALAMLKLQSAAEAAVVVYGREHAKAFEAEAAWEAAGADMVAELAVGERMLHATHGHLLAVAIAELRLKTAN